MAESDELLHLRSRLDRLAAELDEIRRVVSVLQTTAVEPVGPPALNASPPLPVIAPTTATGVAGDPAAPVETERSPMTMPALVPRPPEPPPLPPAESLSPPPLPPVSPEPYRHGAAAEGPSPLRVWLERLQLWPPQDNETVEVRLGAWWATRLGTLFAVIGAVFFGVYLSIGTPAWVKWIELAAVALAVTGLGWWMERRWPRFGQVLYAGGQALVFFTALAAYTVPAVKILDSRLIAAGAQLAAVGWIAISAWRRRAPGEATMAVALGYAAAWFSLSGGLHLFATGAALALAAVAVAWRRWLGWPAPSIVALFGYWGILALLVGGLSFATTPLLPDWIWVAVLGGFLLFVWRDDPAGAPFPPVPSETLWFQNTASTLAVLVGWGTAWLGFDEHMGWFYVSAAGVLGLAAWRRWSLSPDDRVGAVLLAKCMGAVTLAVLTWTDSRTTAIALLVQAGVMVAVNHRLRSTVMGAAAAIVWTLSLFYRLEELAGAPLAPATLSVGLSVVYFAGAVAWLLEAARACRRSRPDLAQLLVTVAALVGVGLGFATVLRIEPPEWLPARLVGAALTTALLAGIWRERLVAGAGGVLLLGAHGALWWVLGDSADRTMALNALVVLLPTLGAAALLGRRGESAADSGAGQAAKAAWLLSAVAVVSATVTGRQLYEPEVVLLLAAGLTVALSVAAPFRRRRGWMWLAAWTTAVGTGAFLLSPLSSGWGVAATGTGFIWLGVAVLQANRRTAVQLARESPMGGAQRAVVILGLIWAVAASVAMEPGLERGLALAGGLALVAAGCLTWVGIGAFAGTAWALWLGALAAFFFAPAEAARWIVVAAVTAALPALAWGRWPTLLRRWRDEGGAADATISIQGWVAAVLTLGAIQVTQESGGRVGWALGVAVIVAALARRLIPSLIQVARALAAAAWVWSLVLWAEGSTADWGAPTLGAALVGLWVAGLPLFLRWRPTAQLAGAWIAAGAGLLLVFLVAWAQRGDLRPFVTVLWGTASLVWFALGLAGRSRPHRLWGLIGLLVCIPRVFVVDLQSTLHRIAAFAALGVVLLWVGFSYHRFRHWITEDQTATGEEGKG